jgi:hypothetical protein
MHSLLDAGAPNTKDNTYGQPPLRIPARCSHVSGKVKLPQKLESAERRFPECRQGSRPMQKGVVQKYERV